MLEASHRYFHQAADVLNLAGDREFWLCFGAASGYGRYVKPRYGPGTSFTEVQAHPLHILASSDFTCLQIYPSEDCAVVDDVPHVIADLLESDVLALERIAQEVLTG